MTLISRILSTVVVSTFLIAPLHAGDADAFVPAAPPPADPWEFSLTPYAWAAGLSGTVGIGNAVSDIDLSFSDLLENLDIGAMMQFEARKGCWGFLFDGFWLRLDSTASTPGPLFSGAKVTVEELRLEALLAYRVAEGPTTFDVLAGASYFSIDTDLDLIPGGPPLGLPGGRRSSSADWVDPVVGFRLRHDFSERWFALLRAEIGGFGAGSDLTWKAIGGFGYRTGESTTVFLGYRHLAIDYSDAAFIFDTETSGLIMGMEFAF